MSSRKSSKLISTKGISFKHSQIVDQGEGWYVVDDGVMSSSSSESASLHALIRSGDNRLRKMRCKRKIEEVKADKTKIHEIVRQYLSDIVDVIGEKYA